MFEGDGEHHHMQCQLDLGRHVRQIVPRSWHLSRLIHDKGAGQQHFEVALQQGEEKSLAEKKTFIMRASA